MEKDCLKSTLTKDTKHSESQASSNQGNKKRGKNFTDDDFDLEIAKMSS